MGGAPRFGTWAPGGGGTHRVKGWRGQVSESSAGTWVTRSAGGSECGPMACTHRVTRKTTGMSRPRMMARKAPNCTSRPTAIASRGVS